MKKTFLCFFIFTFLFLANHASATTYSFNNSSFTPYGDASYASGEVQLTSPANGQSGSIFLDTALRASSFIASFDFKISEINSPYGADGVTFAWVIHQGSGAGGGELGFTGLDGYMVEFDHYWNSGYEPPGSALPFDNTNHVAIAQAVDNPLDYFLLPFDLEDNIWRHVDITFNNGQLKLQIDSVEYLNSTIPGYSSFDAYFGFTGSTGASYSRQLVRDFELTINQPAVPEPTTVLLLGAGAICLAGLGRKAIFRKG